MAEALRERTHETKTRGARTSRAARPAVLWLSASVEKLGFMPLKMVEPRGVEPLTS